MHLGVIAVATLLEIALYAWRLPHVWLAVQKDEVDWYDLMCRIFNLQTRDVIGKIPAL